MSEDDTGVKIGRPTKYYPELCDELPHMFKDGESLAEVCAYRLGVTQKTFLEWVHKYPEFAEAYDAARTISEAWWTKCGRAMTLGKLPGAIPASWIFNMKNRFGWRDKIDHTVRDGTNAPRLIEGDMTEAEAAEAYRAELRNDPIEGEAKRIH